MEDALDEKPCTIDGVDYPSCAAAARALGVTYQAIQSRIKTRLNGGPHKRGRKPKAVTLDGITATLDEHATRLGISRSAVCGRAKRRAKRAK